MAGVELRNVTKAFGPVVAVESADVNFEEGSFTTLLGPSGCGKTTILRMIAGLEATSAGDIHIGGRRINDVPIHKRNLGLVFQNYALFPHRTIEQNIAFGLKYRGVSKADQREKVKKALDIVRLPGVEERFPSQLSGGQQQRIALARAIVIEPDVLLLDEPLSALDANLREEMRVELKTIQRRIGVTTVFVTHDQSEALALSDKIVVMSEGHVEQTGSPQDVYRRPASAFVARFLGNSNILPATVTGKTAKAIKVSIDGLGEVTVEGEEANVGDKVHVVMRAENLHLQPVGSKAARSGNRFRGTITAVDYQGQLARYFIDVGGHALEAVNTIDGSPLAEGTKVMAALRAVDIVLLAGEM